MHAVVATTAQPINLFEPFQKIGFVVLYKRITLSVMVGFLNKVILVLPQRTNIAWEQKVVAYGEPPILKMP